MTCATAAAVLATSSALPLPSSGEVDLGDTDQVDSAAVAVLIALKRRAESEGRPLAFANAPAAIPVLADLYGVEDILG